MIPKTGIEYLDRVYNPVKGKCPTDCWYCYMKRPPWCWSVDKNPTLRLQGKTLYDHFPKEPSRIGVGYNIELFHPKILNGWIQCIITEIETRGQDHTFLFLTKFPERYAEFDFPKNCWLGVSVTGKADYWRVQAYRDKPNLKFVSFEPLFQSVGLPCYEVAPIP